MASEMQLPWALATSDLGSAGCARQVLPGCGRAAPGRVDRQAGVRKFTATPERRAVRDETNEGGSAAERRAPAHPQGLSAATAAPGRVGLRRVNVVRVGVVAMRVDPSQRRECGVVAAHAVGAGPGRCGRGADIDPGDAGRVRVERDAGTEHELQRVVAAGDHVAADVVGVVGFGLRDRPGRAREDPLAEPWGEPFDLRLDLRRRVTGVASGHVGAGHRVPLGRSDLSGAGQGTAARVGRCSEHSRAL